ncbi:MAG TPA: DUF3347 domain-containing protein [Bacteroidia bacterium]|nr:DUF3347 domain-containing protein [Bacteroidia bacterium]
MFAIVIVASVFIQNVAAQTDSSAFSSVIASYLDLKNALIKDNGDSARAAAKVLFNAISKVPMEKLSAGHHKVWMQHHEKLSYDAEHIKQTDELEHQREHFAKLSLNMYKMLKGLNMNTINLYYQFCPMANDGKGAYWLSEDEKIRNPYFGKRMMTCGSAKDTLKVTGNR